MRKKRYEGDPPVHTRIVKIGSRSHRRKVVQRTVQYSREKGHQVILDEVFLGYLPPLCDDLDMMDKEKPKRGRPQKKRARETAPPFGQEVVLSFESICYPIFMATGSGVKTCEAMVRFCRNQTGERSPLFPDLRKDVITSDVVRDVHVLFGKFRHIGSFAWILRSIMRRPDEHAAYALDFRSGPGEVVLSQTFARNTPDFAPQALEFLNGLDKRGAMVTLRQCPDTAELLESVLEDGADYLVELDDHEDNSASASGSPLLPDVRSLFANTPPSKMSVAAVKSNAAHTHNQARTGAADVIAASVRVLPGSLVDARLLSRWPGLEEGCVAEVTFQRVTFLRVTFQRTDNGQEQAERRAETKADAQTREEVRHFASSLWCDDRHIANTLLELAQKRLGREREGRLSMHIAYQVDRTRCQNGAYLKGKRALATAGDTLSGLLDTPW